MIVLKGERENPVYESLLPLQNNLVALEPQHGVEEGPLVLTRVLWIVWGKAGFVFIVVDVVLWIERVVLPWVAAVVKAISHLDLHDDPAITRSLQKTLETIPVFVVSRGQIVEPPVGATEGLDLVSPGWAGRTWCCEGSCHHWRSGGQVALPPLASGRDCRHHCHQEGLVSVRDTASTGANLCRA
ncbi:MAG: hypothetical protein CME24_18380 [Gemmatimonadetes bacterium]|nr:hypothetical protein [Gemmatimonadota bacterium]